MEVLGCSLLPPQARPGPAPPTKRLWAEILGGLRAVAVGQRGLGSCSGQDAPPAAQALTPAPAALPISTPCLQALENLTQPGPAEGPVCVCEGAG